MRMQGYCDVYKWTILKRTSPEVKCLHPTSSMREMCTSSVSNVIYHKFSHGAAFYTLNGKNVNVMLEYIFTLAARVSVVRMSVPDQVGHLTRKSEVLGSIPGLAIYFRSPSADSRGAVVSYWRKYVHEVLINRF